MEEGDNLHSFDRRMNERNKKETHREISHISKKNIHYKDLHRNHPASHICKM